MWLCISWCRHIGRWLYLFYLSHGYIYLIYTRGVLELPCYKVRLERRRTHRITGGWHSVPGSGRTYKLEVYCSPCSRELAYITYSPHTYPRVTHTRTHTASTLYTVIPLVCPHALLPASRPYLAARHTHAPSRVPVSAVKTF